MRATGGLDTDNDTWSDAQEQYLGTETTKACQQNPEFPVVTGGANNEAPLDNWPLDLNDDGVANSIDVGQYVPRLNRAVNMLGSGSQAATTRHDLNADGFVNSIDVGFFAGATLNNRCDRPLPNPDSQGYPTYSSQTQ